MHDGHDHPPRHRGHRREGNGRGHAQPGHNRPAGAVAQWQAPPAGPPSPGTPDFDLVEAAFCRAAETASDAISLLRLAQVPFVGVDAAGQTLRLLSYRIERETEVGAIAPGFDAADPAYQPLPAARVRSLCRLRFLYHSAAGLRELELADARQLRDITPPA